MPTALVCFTRDLRVHDNPALADAVTRADTVVPVFVLDDDVLATRHRNPNRLGFLLESLADLDRSLAALGAGLVVRRGTWVDEVLRLAQETGATAVHVADDVSTYAQARLRELEAEATAVGVAVARAPGVMVVEPGTLRTGSGGAYRVFTPFHRQWQAAPRRAVVPPPRQVVLPPGVAPNGLPALRDLTAGARSPDVAPGGETAGRERLAAFAAADAAHYGADGHDDLARDRTSRCSPYLHFGCLSPLETATRLEGRAPAFVRQLCWRDFYGHLLGAHPELARVDVRDRGDRWSHDDEAFAAWAEGRTGYPLVDAGMRQLRREGWMHNRARLVAASFLTKDLYLDWRRGADHFMDWLVDGDVANNQLNWQWTAGTGTDSNPHRIFNPTVQAQRFDPTGDYVRRYVPELAALPAPAIHDPGPLERVECGYPAPIVDHRAAIEEYRARLARDR